MIQDYKDDDPDTNNRRTNLHRRYWNYRKPLLELQKTLIWWSLLHAGPLEGCEDVLEYVELSFYKQQQALSIHNKQYVINNMLSEQVVMTP